MNRSAAKKLDSTAAAARYTRSWFDDLQRRVDAGGWYVLADADTPHEIFRALGIDYVVTQWWSALISAKQLAPGALAALSERGYPDDRDQYNSIPLGAALLDRDLQPWGGLPPPALVVAGVGPDSQRGVLRGWQEALGTEVWGFERAVGGEGARWWEHIATDWEHVVGAARLDLMEGQIGELVAWCEAATGRRLDHGELGRVLDRANEQAAWNRRSRDILAAARPTPIDVADTIPAVMLPQWQRGTSWAVDAARELHDEIERAIARGDRVVEDERVRLMWVGRGLWFDPGFVQRFHDRGAVFVWSMYHALAADAYERRGDDALRSLAARFAPFPDILGTPGWVDEWYVAEARRSGVDGVVHVPAEGHRSAHVSTVALRSAGIPVFELEVDNADGRVWDAEQASRSVRAFLDAEVEPVAARRREREGAGRVGDEGDP